MSEPTVFKYRAFLSYSHVDTKRAKWLHGRLERFPIDKELVGRETSAGPIPLPHAEFPRLRKLLHTCLRLGNLPEHVACMSHRPAGASPGLADFCGFVGDATRMRHAA
jgi:hypothetical protein